MRSETKKQLDRVLFMRKVKIAGAGLALAVAGAAVLYLTGLDASVENRTVAGVIEKVGPYNGTNNQGVMNGLAVDVKLDDGREAHVLVMKKDAPTVGDRIQVVEHVHGSGRTTFTWK